MSDVEIKECHRNNTCVTCDDDECSHKGDLGADCPKWKCDNDPYGDCEHCDFIKHHLKELYGIDVEEISQQYA